MNVDARDNLLGEVQIHIQEMIDAKDIAHGYYEITRVLDEKQDAGKDLTEQETLEYKAAAEKQREIYSLAREAFTRRTNSSFDMLNPSIVLSVANLGDTESNLTNPTSSPNIRATGTPSISEKETSLSESNSSEETLPVESATSKGDLIMSEKDNILVILFKESER